jgi:hypothetical protein
MFLEWFWQVQLEDTPTQDHEYKKGSETTLLGPSFKAVNRKI